MSEEERPPAPPEELVGGVEPTKERETLYESLDRKVELGVRLYDLVEQTSETAPTSVVAEQLQNYVQDVSDALPGAEAAAQQAEVRRKELRKVIESERVEIPRGDSESERLWNEILLLRTSDVVFFETIRHGTKSLIQKRERVEKMGSAWRDRGKEAFTFLPKELKNFKGTVDFRGFSANFFLPRGEYERFYRILLKRRGRSRSNGMHIPGTPINLIAGDPSTVQAQDTYRHEEIHNIGESFLRMEHPQDAMKLIAANLERIERSIELQLPEFFIKSEEKYFHQHIRGYVDSLHGEFAAQVPHETRAEKHKIEEILVAMALGFEPGPRNTSLYGQRIVRELRKSFEQKQNPRVKTLLDSGADEARRSFEQATAEYSDGRDVARFWGMEKEFQVLSLLFRPTEYRHINHYLRYKLGTRYDIGLFAGRPLDERFLDGVIESSGFLEKDPTVRSKVMKLLSDEGALGFDWKVYETFEELEAYRQKVIMTYKYLGLGQEGKNASDSVTYQWFSGFLSEHALRAGNVRSLIEHVKGNDREIFDELVHDTVSTGNIFDDLKWEGETDAIRDAELWKTLSELGFGKSLEEGLTKLKTYLEKQEG